METLKLDAGNIAEADVKASSVFKALQSHFSVVFADNSQQKAQLEETKRLLVASKQQQIAQVGLVLTVKYVHKPLCDRILEDVTCEIIRISIFVHLPFYHADISNVWTTIKVVCYCFSQLNH